jgi:hypothetical protein
MGFAVDHGEGCLHRGSMRTCAVGGVMISFFSRYRWRLLLLVAMAGLASWSTAGRRVTGRLEVQRAVVGDSAVITEKTFALSHGSFWQELLPNSERHTASATSSGSKTPATRYRPRTRQRSVRTGNSRLLSV